MADHQPGPGEDLVQFFLVDIGIDEDLAADGAATGIDHWSIGSLVVVIPGMPPCRFKLIASAPTGRRCIVRLTRIHPGAFAIGEILPLPERRLRFQPVDQERRGVERRLPVRCGRNYQNDVLAGP